VRVGIVHYNMEVYGGAEHVGLNAIKSLHEAGHSIGLCATAYPYRKQTLVRVGIDVEDCIDYFIQSRRYPEPDKPMPFLGIYQRVGYSYFPIKKLCHEYSPDILLVTQGVTIIPTDWVDRTYTYVHYPIDHELDHEHYMSSWFWRIYRKPMKFILQNLDQYKDTHLITNSGFTAGVIKKLWNRDAHVIYPPCPLYLDLPLNGKRDVVCTLMRYTPEKRYELALDVARALPKIEFHFVGSVVPAKYPYLRGLMSRAKGLKNVHFHIDAPLIEKLEVLGRSKALLHTMYGEHFGISLIEAMSAGSVPVPHNSGGAKVDDYVPSEFRWDEVDEAVDKTERTVYEWCEELGNAMRERSKFFSQQNFRRNLATYINDTSPHRLGEEKTPILSNLGRS